jgi:hypothetical protein
MTALRPSLVPGLLQNLRTNVSRHQYDVRLFEIGRVFAADGKESLRLALAATGRRTTGDWERTEKSDYFDLKGACYFDWYGSAGQLGREFFVGTLFQDDTLELSGTSVVAIPGVGGPNGVIAGMYFAILDSSGNRMVGDWSGNTGGIPGDFVATRIPEPCTGITCAFAVMCIVTMRCRRGR